MLAIEGVFSKVNLNCMWFCFLLTIEFSCCVELDTSVNPLEMFVE